MSEKVHNLRFPVAHAARALIAAAAICLGLELAVVSMIGRGDLTLAALLAGAVVTAIALLALVPVWFASTLGPANLPTAWLASTAIRLMLCFGAAAGLALANIASITAVALLLVAFYAVMLVVEAVLIARYAADPRHDWSDPAATNSGKEAASC